MITISYFAAPTEKSLELYKNIESFCTKNNYGLSFINALSCSQYEFLVGIHGDTMSIVDASIEMENGDYLPTVYPILTAQVNIFEHVLVVSRTPIPMNVCPRVTGGFPAFLHQDKKENAEIEEWLKDKIHQIASKELMHPSLRVKINSQDELIDLKPQMERMLEKNLKSNPNRKKRNVLISYRSKDYDRVLDYLESGLDEHLKDNVGKEYQYHIVLSRNEAINEVPIELSNRLILYDRLCAENEAPTPMQRWRMVGQLEGLIREMDEVWIYDTYDYGDSWWTQAEIVMTCYDNYNRSNERKIQVKPMLHESLPEFISKIGDLSEYRQRITRYLSNTRLDTMGPESVNYIQLMEFADQVEEIPYLLKFLVKRKMKKALKMSIPNDLPRKEKSKILKDMLNLYMSPTELRRYANDDVFKDEFWHKISYAVSTNLAKDFEMKKWVLSPMDDLTSATIKELEEASLNGRITLKNKNGSVELIIKKGKPYYLWLATRMGIPTEKDAPGLEKVQTYNLQTI